MKKKKRERRIVLMTQSTKPKAPDFLVTNQKRRSVLQKEEKRKE